MDHINKKAAIAAYKERRTLAGIFAVRCIPAGKVWVGSSPDLSAQKNRLWFALRLGSSRNPAMQKAWIAHGEPAFTFEELERIPDEASSYLRGAALKKRLTHWTSELNSSAI